MEKESQNYPTNQQDRLIRSFGRIKSRKLSDHKNFLLKNLLPFFEINEEFLGQIQNLSESKKFTKFYLEIGFGFGDFIFEKAKQNPDILFFGCEPHLNGIVNLLAKLEKEPLQNLKISSSDVRILLAKFPPKFFDQIFILFPDPWPKAKHFKRRLINLEFLDKILSPKIKNAASLTIATDHDSYKTWILAKILRSKNFSWLANSKKDWQIFPKNWIETKYQKKAAIEGRVSVIFNLICHV
jgi:tRNA (guanine-N7-)-methyltransferase